MNVLDSNAARQDIRSGCQTVIGKDTIAEFFGQTRNLVKMFLAGPYARVSKTIRLQMHALAGIRSPTVLDGSPSQSR